MNNLATSTSLPPSWKFVPLKDLGTWSGGGTPSKSKHQYWHNGAIPWVSPKDMKTERISDSEDHITKEAVSHSAASLIDADSVLVVTRSGILRHTLPVAVNTVPVTVNQDLKALTPRSGIMAEYVAWALRAFSRSILNRCSKQGTTVNSVETSKLLSFEIPVAPPEQQRSIVAEIEKQFSRLDEAVASLKRTKANLKRYKAAVLKAAVEGKLTEDWRKQHPNVEPASKLLERILAERRVKWKEKTKYKEPRSADRSDLPDLPYGWIWARWEQIGLSQNGRAFPSSRYQQSGVKLLRPGNLHVSGKVIWTEDNTRCMPKKWADEFPEFLVGHNELIMNLTAQSLRDEFLGRVCLTGPEEFCLLNQRQARLTPILIDPRFLLWLFKSVVFRRFVDGLNTGSLIQHMFTSQLADFVLPLPPREEQAQIVAEVEHRLSVIDELEATVEANLTRADRLRQATLQKAFSGKLLLNGART